MTFNDYAKKEFDVTDKQLECEHRLIRNRCFECTLTGLAIHQILAAKAAWVAAKGIGK